MKHVFILIFILSFNLRAKNKDNITTIKLYSKNNTTLTGKILECVQVNKTNAWYAPMSAEHKALSYNNVSVKYKLKFIKDKKKALHDESYIYYESNRSFWALNEIKVNDFSKGIKKYLNKGVTHFAYNSSFSKTSVGGAIYHCKQI